MKEKHVNYVDKWFLVWNKHFRFLKKVIFCRYCDKKKQQIGNNKQWVKKGTFYFKNFGEGGGMCPLCHVCGTGPIM